MDPKYLPKNLAGIMDHVFEEKAEVDEAVGSLLRWASKARRFGFASQHPDDRPDGPTNWDMIRNLLPNARAEVLDLLGSLDRLAEAMVNEIESGQGSTESNRDSGIG